LRAGPVRGRLAVNWRLAIGGRRVSVPVGGGLWVRRALPEAAALAKTAAVAEIAALVMVAVTVTGGNGGRLTILGRRPVTLCLAICARMAVARVRLTLLALALVVVPRLAVARLTITRVAIARLAVALWAVPRLAVARLAVARLAIARLAGCGALLLPGRRLPSCRGLCS